MQGHTRFRVNRSVVVVVAVVRQVSITLIATDSSE